MDQEPYRFHRLSYSSLKEIKTHSWKPYCILFKLYYGRQKFEFQVSKNIFNESCLQLVKTHTLACNRYNKILIEDNMSVSIVGASAKWF